MQTTKRGKLTIRTITVHGRQINSLSDVFQFESIGDIRERMTITSYGEENLYFNVVDDHGESHCGFCKCL